MAFPTILAHSEAGPSSPFSRVDYSAEMIERVDQRLQALTDRFLGPGPGESAKTAPRAVPSGILGGLDDLASTLSARAERMHDCLNRIEAALP